jgi:hypothetical protein
VGDRFVCGAKPLSGAFDSAFLWKELLGKDVPCEDSVEMFCCADPLAANGAMLVPINRTMIKKASPLRKIFEFMLFSPKFRYFKL